MYLKKLIYLTMLCTIHHVAPSQQHIFSTQRLQQIVNNNQLINNNTITSSAQNSSRPLQTQAPNNRLTPSSPNSFSIMQQPQQIIIRLTLGDTQTNAPAPSPLTFNEPTTPDMMHLIHQAVTQQICTKPDLIIENPIAVALQKALQTMMPADATISLIYEPTFLSPKTTLSNMAHCETTQKTALQEININTTNQNSFNLIKKRLIIDNKIVPILQKFLAQKSSDYSDGLHDPHLLRLALAVRIIIRDLKNV